MWYLANFRRLRDAQAFVDYMQSIGVSCKLQIDGTEIKLFLQDEMQLEQARKELERFGREPTHARYRLASWQLSESNPVNPQLTGLYKGFSIIAAFKNTGPFTLTILAICTLVYLYTGQGMNDAARAPFMFFASAPEMFDLQQIWRWVTPAFLHFGIFHFLFNMGAWWIFGGMVEKGQSGSRLFLIFAATALLSNGVQFFWSGNLFGGLSGVVYAVIGYLWVYQRLHPAPPFRIPNGMMAFMLVALALGFTNFIPTANQAHLAGLLGGCALGWLLAWMDRPDHAGLV
ncbi:rhomboid family intramembrane serine protease GlpG [Ketobacter sp. MCCC 1A13808]|uniref:rhomboid family intramembrane serine protease GlpG n=1 Tax=Ketobacter sp. MCCC 1A13808 TaxID=2602738 RepID=UPI000F15E97E|nr:rhomboid family intramembrane serine protease GlpG [Ketobacter sp. MCCC 1A13808]MVF12799.1 rhomboid family intramembrane serine protease GlpG [Ketobacter sp. MCCC 1A13808]RLP54526.1 MAG: rhomboid family intramembrane serine protease GlpG [Ketobacter sp.]